MPRNPFKDRKDTVLAAVAGLALGAVVAGASVAAQAPAEPEVITETRTVVETEEVEVEVKTTPEACLQAIDYADEVITANTESWSIMAQSLDALERLDFDQSDLLTQDLRTHREDVLEPAMANYFANAALCQ